MPGREVQYAVNRNGLRHRIVLPKIQEPGHAEVTNIALVYLSQRTVMQFSEGSAVSRPVFSRRYSRDISSLNPVMASIPFNLKLSA